MRKKAVYAILAAMLLLSGCGAAAAGMAAPPGPRVISEPAGPEAVSSPAPEPPASTPTPAPSPAPKRKPVARLLCLPVLTAEPEPAPTPPPAEQPMPCAATKLTVLMYHHLVADGEPVVGMTVTAGRFAEDMQWLKDNGYTTVLPRELAAGGRLPEKAVMITFDDGYASNYHYAFPVLKELEMKAAIAVIGRVVDAYDLNTLDWDMCREMHDSGLVEIGSHTYNLHNLDGAGGAYVQGGPNGIMRREGETREEYEIRVLPDLQKSINVIEEQLGAAVTFLAYPYGVKDSWAAGYIADHFAVTLLTKSGVADLSHGLYSLPRKTVTMDCPAAACFRSY